MNISAQDPLPSEPHVIKIPRFHFSTVFLFLAVFALGVGSTVGIINFTSKNKGPQKTITILAKGRVQIPADESDISLITEKNFLSKNDSENYIAKAESAIKTTMKNLNIPESFYTLYSYSSYGNGYFSQAQSVLSVSMLTPSPAYLPSPSIPNKDSGYTAHISLSVNLKNEYFKQTDKVSKAINSLEILDNPNLVVYYYANESSEYLDKARAKALSDANKQIEELRKLNNIKIGEVISIKDLTIPEKDKNGSYPPSPVWANNSRLYVQMGERSAEYVTSYEVVYLLK